MCDEDKISLWHLVPQVYKKTLEDVRFDKYEQTWYDYIALKGKSNFNAYTSESGIVETDYKCIVKEHL